MNLIAGTCLSQMAAAAATASSSSVLYRLPTLKLSAKVSLNGNWQPFYKLGAMPHIRHSYRLVDVRAMSASTESSSFGRFNSKYREDRLKLLSELVEDIGRTAVDTGPQGAIRFAQGIEAVVSVGGEWALDQLKNLTATGGPNSGLKVATPGPLQLRKLFDKLGATYIKLGQFIASTPSLFPADYVKEFQSCLDRAPPVPFDQIKDIVREDLGRPLEEVYDYIDPAPLASASIAQVHVARLRGSMKEVVIKVLKPGVGDILSADLNFLYVAARVLEFLNPQITRTSLVGIIGDIRASMLEEVDFQKEAVNIEAFRKYIDAAGLSNQATAPQVYRHCSSKRVLTMERLYGVPLTDLNSIRALVTNPEETLITALNVWFGSLLACESFHADVHAGNLLVLKDGRVGFIDFGIVGRILPATWNAIETFLTSIGSGQYTAMAAALVQMGATDTKVDVPKFAKDLEKIFTVVQDLESKITITTAGGPQSATVAATLSMDEQQVNALFLDVVSVSEAYGLRFPREFGILIKQLLYFDRYTRLLAPNLNVMEDERVLLSSDRKDAYMKYRYRRHSD